MKILCDECGGTAAAVFCCADEAALCLACDRRIHRANKVAGKHIRFTLLHSSASEPPPLCDICQERQGIVFCKEDRAILCYDCDFPIHAAKRFKHSRFVLSGTRLAAISVAASSASPELSSSSSISDYLIKMLPGYCVEDLLVDDPVNQLAGKSDDLPLFKEGDLEWEYTEGPPVADLSFCVPDAPPQILPEANLLSAETGYRLGAEFVYKEVGKGPDHRHHVAPAAVAEEQWNGRKEWGTDSAFTVPQLNCVPGSNKRQFRPSAWYF
ncbi:B-box zinc finger protein 20 [Platanthera zijinensis]|uniref:B-box zinc finger protein 20 n=1 Tax=Platanthera zijinensis TaxID=2320716 RepID=A0AAP0BWN8_9ASPA